MDSVKYIGMDVHKETISIAVRNSSGKLARRSWDQCAKLRHGFLLVGVISFLLHAR